MWTFPLLFLALIGQQPCDPRTGRCPIPNNYAPTWQWAQARQNHPGNQTQCAHGELNTRRQWYQVFAQDGSVVTQWGYKCPNGWIHHTNDAPVQMPRTEPRADDPPKSANPIIAKKTQAPIAPVTAAAPDPLKNGVDRSQLSKVEKFTVPGPSQVEAMAVIEGKENPVINDGRLHVTVIGTDAERLPVMQDLERDPRLTILAPQVMLQDYTPDEFAVADVGLYAGKGHPEIVLQQPQTGKVVARFVGYAGPEPLADRITEELRRANPRYDPSLDPTPGVKTCPLGFTNQHWPLVALTAAAVAYMLLTTKRKV